MRIRLTILALHRLYSFLNVMVKKASKNLKNMVSLGLLVYIYMYI